MQIVEGIARALGFRTLPTTVLTVAVYAALLSAVIYTDDVPSVPPPKGQHGLNLTQAYADLHEITARPHPFLSHANDLVHSFIVGRVSSIAKEHPHVSVVDDLLSNTSWTSWGNSSFVVYNEATNVLVKIQGTEPDLPGVLFSAHYDSVSTASGTTDDGMGVATLIQLVQYFAENQPRRTAVFNINNGEEDGLNGAFVFMKHEWSNLTDSFLNLEGAAAGGRPLLFRGTSTPALRAFHVPHPYGNVLSSDAFARGFVRSGTDYTVYTGFGMEGLDFAFTKGRSKYHTKYDAIPYTLGQEGALWAMMESSQFSGMSLLNSDKTHGSGAPPVYFDLFGRWLVVMPMHYLYIANIFMLVVGPLVLIVLLVVEAAMARGAREAQNGHAPTDTWTAFTRLGWVKGTWLWAKFWAAAAVCLALQSLLMFLYLRFNPYIVYSRPSLVIVSSFTLAYLSFFFIIAPSSTQFPEKQKHVMLLQTYILTWLLLVLGTLAVNSGIGGVYFITIWNAAVWLACLVGFFETLVGSGDQPTPFFRRGHGGHVRYAPLPQREDRAGADSEAATESTPLITRSPQPPPAETGAIGWWIPQLLLAVGVPITLVTHISVLLVASLSQTLSDGSPASTVYRAIALLMFMTVLPVVPFTFKVHSLVANASIIIFIVIVVSAMTMFPFSMQEPLKVFYQQTVALGDVSAPLENITYGTSVLYGAESYFVRDLLSKIPTALSSTAELACGESSTTRVGLVGCMWKSELLPLPSPGDASGPTTPARWFSASATSLNSTSARFVFSGRRNTRGCRISLTQGRITRHLVHGSEGDMLPNGSPNATFTEVRLWSRDWDAPVTVDVEWEGTALAGQLTCSWAEYASGSVGVEGAGRIPAFEEVVTFLPTWAAVTKLADGLVDASYTFSL
ncbi:Peptide hydrolase [Mycena chlorophos]|uniref:Peptide hydrolase n=1 Tax=Mycena chlorophos TaxID=658473 RepID=A0A8H6TTC0_MYCCL|nr:Peptide hydrolase [Mycena chlorophos]